MDQMSDSRQLRPRTFLQVSESNGWLGILAASVLFLASYLAAAWAVDSYEKSAAGLFHQGPELWVFVLPTLLFGSGLMVFFRCHKSLVRALSRAVI